jgi:hypothetical protein
MMADRLTKALPARKWNGFLHQLGLEDVEIRYRETILRDNPMKNRLEAVEEE